MDDVPEELLLVDRPDRLLIPPVRLLQRLRAERTAGANARHAEPAENGQEPSQLSLMDCSNLLILMAHAYLSSPTGSAGMALTILPPSCGSSATAVAGRLPAPTLPAAVTPCGRPGGGTRDPVPSMAGTAGLFTTAAFRGAPNWMFRPATIVSTCAS